jgi:hypothetical protein
MDRFAIDRSSHGRRGDAAPSRRPSEPPRPSSELYEYELARS